MMEFSVKLCHPVLIITKSNGQSQMSLVNEYADNSFIGESLILDAHIRLLFCAYHYETPCT